VLRRQDVGHRVVVRRIVGVSQNRPLFTDALGELVELTETDLTLATAKGTLKVPLKDVHRAKRVPRFLAKASLWDVPVLGRTLSGSRQIPVSRGSVEAGASLDAARTSFADDGVVVIYPEGTITRDPEGWPMNARSGAARLALDSDVPVVPVVHWGTLSVYDHYKRRFRPSWRTTITVRAGDPVPLDDVRARAREAGPDRDRSTEVALLRETTERMMSAVRDLLADVRGEAAPEPTRRPRGSGT